MTFEARYIGTCAGCGSRIHVGDLIETRRDTPDSSPQHFHATCPDDPVSLRPGEHVCTECWLIHPEGACQV